VCDALKFWAEEKEEEELNIMRFGKRERKKRERKRLLLFNGEALSCGFEYEPLLQHTWF